MDKHDRQTFNDSEFLRNLRRSLANHSKATFELTFHGNSENPEEAELEIEQDCPGLVALKREFPDKVHLRWTSKKPRQHYTVVDKESVLLEESEHNPAKQPFMVLSTDRKWVGKWDERFDKYSESAHELSF